MKGRCIKYGDDISTDLIIAGKYPKSLDVKMMSTHAMEDLDCGFSAKMASGQNVIVAGKYFGCGSSREQAPLVLKVAGVKFIVAKSFSRIFYRNAINLGIPIVICNTDSIDDSDELSYKLGASVIRNETKGEDYNVEPLPASMVEILKDGGVEAHLKKKGGF